MSSTTTTEDTPADDSPSELDREIDLLRSQITCLKSQRSHYVSTLLSSARVLSKLSSFCSSPPPPQQREPSLTADDAKSLLSKGRALTAQNQVNLYRLCATITSFRVRDPDPNAAHGGRLFALRFDVSNKRKFIRPYYVIFTTIQETESQRLLQIHRHTLPPAIPLQEITKRYLPQGKGVVAMGTKAARGTVRQSLPHFCRALRHAIVAYHNRQSALESLRGEFHLDDIGLHEGQNNKRFLADISAADAEMKQICIEWIDGRVGRLLVNDSGNIINCIVLRDAERDGKMERRIGLGRLESLSDKLKKAQMMDIDAERVEEIHTCTSN